MLIRIANSADYYPVADCGRWFDRPHVYDYTALSTGQVAPVTDRVAESARFAQAAVRHEMDTRPAARPSN
jgi:hypothetical protein